MSTQIPTAFVDKFRGDFEHLIQANKSYLTEAVTQDMLTGAEFGYRDQLGAVVAQQIVTRHGDTPFTEVPHARRRFQTLPWELGEIIDKQDTERMLTSPTSGYAEAFANAFNRQRDKTILEAMFADASTGRSGATTVALPAGQQIAVDYVEAGTAANSSLTLGKLRRALELLGDVGGEEGEMYIAVTRREINAMLRTLEYGSADYNMARPLMDGGKEPKMFMGLKWILLPNLVRAPDGTTTLQTMFPVDGSSHRRIPVWSKNAVLYAQTAATEITAAPDPTKRFNTRLYGRADFGATRLQEIGVVEIKCHATTF